MNVLITSMVAALVAGSMIHFQTRINIYFMGFFRDLARIKAKRRRLGGNQKALASSLSTQELKMLFLKEESDPLEGLHHIFETLDERNNRNLDDKEGSSTSSNSKNTSSIKNDIDVQEYTREELYEFGNGLNGNPILISLYGRVYDVSSGSKFYGPEGKYRLFSGRDVTRALSTGCLNDDCLGSITSITSNSSSNNSETSEKDITKNQYSHSQIQEGKKWLSFFETHDSYKFVGFLKDESDIDILIDHLVEKDLQKKEA